MEQEEEIIERLKELERKIDWIACKLVAEMPASVKSDCEIQDAMRQAGHL